MTRVPCLGSFLISSMNCIRFSPQMSVQYEGYKADLTGVSAERPAEQKAVKLPA